MRPSAVSMKVRDGSAMRATMMEKRLSLMAPCGFLRVHDDYTRWNEHVHCRLGTHLPHAIAGN
jgi:hypothetical protein